MNTVIVKGGAFYDSVFVSNPSVYRATPAYLGWEDRVKGGRHTRICTGPVEHSG